MPSVVTGTNALAECCYNPEESYHCAVGERRGGNVCHATDTQPGIVKDSSRWDVQVKEGSSGVEKCSCFLNTEPKRIIDKILPKGLPNGQARETLSLR